MNNVVRFDGNSIADIPPDQVLQSAQEADLKQVVVLGYEQDGFLYIAASKADAAQNILLCERFTHEMMKHLDMMDEDNG